MRILLTLMLSILFLLQARLWLSDEGMSEVWKLEAQLSERTEENHQLAIRNAVLEGEVVNLKEGIEAAEERARTDLGMIAEGETFYMVARPSSQINQSQGQNLSSSFPALMSPLKIEQ
jgi:cell division protein FtsB